MDRGSETQLQVGENFNEMKISMFVSGVGARIVCHHHHPMQTQQAEPVLV